MHMLSQAKKGQQEEARGHSAQKMPLTPSRAAGGGGGGCCAVTRPKVKSLAVVLNEASAMRSQLISMRSLSVVTERKQRDWHR